MRSVLIEVIYKFLYTSTYNFPNFKSSKLDGETIILLWAEILHELVSIASPMNVCRVSQILSVTSDVIN